MITQLLSIDFLKVSYQRSIPNDFINIYYLNPDCYIEIDKSIHYDTMYQKICKLFLNEQYIGRMFFFPRKHMLSTDYVQIVFDNSLLYDFSFVTFHDYLLNELDFKFIKISAIDIALDVADSNVYSFLNNFWMKTSTKNKKYLIQHKGSSYVSKNGIEIKRDKNNKYKKEPDTNTIYIGTINKTSNSVKKTGRFFRIYNKLEEINTHSEKEYIKKFWKKNGLNYSNNVERVEVSLSKTYTLDIDFNKLSDIGYLAYIYNIHLNACLSFFKRERKHNKYVDTPCNPLIISVNYKPQPLEKAENKKINKNIISDKNKKMILKFSFFQFLVDINNPKAKESFIYQLKSYNLKDFYLKRFKYFLEDFKNKNNLSIEEYDNISSKINSLNKTITNF